MERKRYLVCPQSCFKTPVTFLVPDGKLKVGMKVKCNAFLCPMAPCHGLGRCSRKAEVVAVVRSVHSNPLSMIGVGDGKVEASLIKNGDGWKK